MCLKSGNKIFITQGWFYEVFKQKGRLIYSPSKELRAAQKELLLLLRQSFPLKISSYKTAKCHVGKKWVLKMDIADFYDSVPYGDIKEVIELVCKKKLSFADRGHYVNLTTLYEKLPTGALTSAHIANACFQKVEFCIKPLSSYLRVGYSRYMDDLTFSCDDKNILNAIEKEVRKILSEHGYKINEKKIKYISDNRCQNILGLVVNGNSVRIPSEKKRIIRSMLYNYANGYNNRTEKLRGYISYVKSVDKKYYVSLKIYAHKLEKRFCISDKKLKELF